ncbi:MAG: LysE family translocator [Polyangiaceae bacterium]
MLGIHDYWVFVAAGIVLNLTPGQDTLYIAGRSIAAGRKVGIASALGVGTGGLVHAIAASAGLSTVLATSALAFTLVKWAGVAYLIYLGARLLVSRAGTDTLRSSTDAGGGGVVAFRRGVLTNVLNPKVALFFLAFLPQFVDPQHGNRTLSFLVLGGTFVFTGTLWCLVIAIASARASAGIRQSGSGSNLLRRIAGAVFVGLGIKLALEQAK